MYKVQVLTETINQKVPGYSAHTICVAEKEALPPSCTQRTLGTTLHRAPARLEMTHKSSCLYRRHCLNRPSLSQACLCIGSKLWWCAKPSRTCCWNICKITEEPIVSRMCLLKNTWNNSVASPPASVGKVAISSHVYSTKIPAVLIPFLRSLIFFSPRPDVLALKRKVHFRTETTLEIDVWTCILAYTTTTSWLTQTQNWIYCRKSGS